MSRGRSLDKKGQDPVFSDWKRASLWSDIKQKNMVQFFLMAKNEVGEGRWAKKGRILFIF